MKLAIIIPAEGLYSETFIQNHVKYLKSEKIIIYGTDIQNLIFNKKQILPQYWYVRLSQKILSLFNIDSQKLGCWRLKRLLKREKVTTVLAEYGFTGAMIAPICNQLKIELIVHFHGNDASVYSVLNKNKTQYLYMFQHAKAIIAVSKRMVDRLIKIGARNHNVFYNCYGIDTLFFQKTQRPLSKRLLAVGRFVDKKAPHLAILACAKAIETQPGIKLHMVGDGPLLDACIELVKALKITDNIIFEGVCEQEKILELHKMTDVFIQHSVIAPNGDAEGTPLAILEALASGIPVISTKHEGIIDVVKDGENGFLVDEFDINGMALRILELTDNTSMLNEFSNNARLQVEKNNSLDIQINKLESIIMN